MMTSPATDAWMASGKLRTAKKFVISVLQERFSDEAISPTIKTKIEQTNNLPLLGTWHRKAATTPSVSEFERIMIEVNEETYSQYLPAKAKAKTKAKAKSAKKSNK